MSNTQNLLQQKAHEIIDLAIEETYRDCRHPYIFIIGPSILERDPTPLYVCYALQGKREGTVNSISNGGGEVLEKIRFPCERRYVSDLFKEQIEDMVENHNLKPILPRVGTLFSCVAEGGHDLLIDHKSFSYIAGDAHESAKYNGVLLKHYGTDNPIHTQRELEEVTIAEYDEILNSGGRMLFFDLHPLNPDLDPETPPNLAQFVIPWLKKKGYAIRTFENVDDTEYPTEELFESSDPGRIFCETAVLARKTA